MKCEALNIRSTSKTDLNVVRLGFDNTTMEKI